MQAKQVPGGMQVPVFEFAGAHMGFKSGNLNPFIGDKLFAICRDSTNAFGVRSPAL
jgi:hypothetical protein